MRQVPPEIETLIWSIAESPTEKAVQEFHARYPTYAGELARRIATVRALKGAGKENPARRPGFTPRPEPAPAGRTAAWAAGLALAAVAVASFTFAIFARRQPDAPAPQPVPMVIRPTPKPVIVPAPVPKPDPEPNFAQDTQEGDVGPVEDAIPKWQKPRQVSLKGVALVTALQTIAAQSGLQIQIDPGMPNPTISVSYRDMNTVEILKKMGSEYAFTPYDQGDGTVIIVPAREDEGSNSSDPERKRYDNPS
ncbi:hypothetical protein EON81_03205 [bacterium]|nr:MAG: hypothetical protein EON81_03205 [bacterium]